MQTYYKASPACTIPHNFPMSPQCRTILKHLKTGRNLTQVSATELYRVHRLAARITELKSLGYDILSIRCKDVTGRAYALYRYVGQDKVNTNPGIEGIY
jgi:hypothetical protein